MFVGRNYDVADGAENEVYGMDFVNDMAAADVMNSAAWALSVESGVDPNPNSHLSGSPQIFSRTVTLQRIYGLVAGVTYIVTVTIGTTGGNTIVLWSRIPCEVIG